MKVCKLPYSDAQLIFDGGIPECPRAFRTLESGSSWDDVLNEALLEIQAAGCEVQVYAGRRALIELARSSRSAIRPRNGRPSVRVYTLVGMVTVLDEQSIGLDALRFSPRDPGSDDCRRLVRELIAAEIEGDIDGGTGVMDEAIARLRETSDAEHEANLERCIAEMREVITWLRAPEPAK